MNAKQTDTLIVYVHGAFASPRSWNYVQKQVNKNVRGSGVRTAEHYFEYDIQEDDAFIITARLTKEVMEHVDAKSPRRVLLVGHSFGGVLCVATSRQIAPISMRGIDMKVITVSAPFGGTRIASIVTMFTPSSTFFNNISHNSSFMWNFKHKPLACSTHSFVTTRGKVKWILGENDGVVTYESQMQFRADPMIGITAVDLNHFEVLMSDNVAAKISSEAVSNL